MQMTSKSAIIVAGLLQVLLRTSVFIEQSNDLCSPAPATSSWIFLIAFLDILYDINIYPFRYMHVPCFVQAIVETIFAILLTEFGAIVVWCTLERLICRVAKPLIIVMGMPRCMYNKWEAYILGTVTTVISLLILAYVGQATDHFHVIRRKYHRIERKVGANMASFWNYARRKYRGLALGNGIHMTSDGYGCSSKKRKRRSRKCT